MATRRTVLVFAVTASIAQPALAQRTSYPDRPVRIVVPSPPAGPSDMVARLLAEAMRGELGQSVIVENKPGAAGLIGTAAVAHSPPDGYTVLLTTLSNHVLAPLVQKNAPVDPVRELTPVVMARRPTTLFGTHPKAPFKSMPEFLAQAKANPNTASINVRRTRDSIGGSPCNRAA